MPQQHTIEVSKLPPSAQKCLQAVGYKRDTIRVTEADRWTMRPPTGTGKRGFHTYACTLGPVTTYGAWGGTNVFVSSIDCRTNAYEIAPGDVHILGCEGGGKPVYAYAVCTSLASIGVAPPTAPELDYPERTCLQIFRRFKASHRRVEMSDRGILPETIDRLVEKGLLARNKAGAVRLTTAGKVAPC